MGEEKEKQFFIETSCVGCCIRIFVLRNDKYTENNEMFISTLSDHAHLWINSWRGRLWSAWSALKGNPLADIELMTDFDIEKFKKGFDKAYNYLKGEKNENN